MTKVVVILGFLVAFGAGLAVGLQNARRETAAKPQEPATRPSAGGREGWLTSALGLNSEQQEQLKKIWSETARRGRGEQDDLRRQYRTERDEAIAALIRPEDKPRYDLALRTYTERTAAMEQQWRTAYQAAVEQTKQVLTPEQRVKYEELLKRHTGPSTQRHTTRRSEDRATTRPAPGTQPSPRETP